MDTVLMDKLDQQIKQFKKALVKLEEIVDVEKNDIVRDSAVKRFEISVDLFWKMLKTYIEINYGIIVSSPKTTIKEAYKQGLIEYDSSYLDLIDLRNETSHMYKEEIAEKVYNFIPESIILLKKVLVKIEKN
ncbi:MAG: HI0074 family nucleotidyltransferase substrate-binding subunit [Patescibacteria group bacterium]